MDCDSPDMLLVEDVVESPAESHDARAGGAFRHRKAERTAKRYPGNSLTWIILHAYSPFIARRPATMR